MERERWKQIKAGMEKKGWKEVCALHPDLPEDVRESLTKDYQDRYLDRYYDHQWYHNHNAYKCLFVKRKDREQIRVTDNSYRKPIIERLDAQTQKGIETYGQVISTNKAPLLHRIEETQKELTDGLVYNEWIMAGLIELSIHVAKLNKHLHDTHGKVHGMAPDNPIRVNHERAMIMAERIHEELGKIGQGK